MTYTQFMGKDNVPFHTLSFPATILGSGEPWKLVDRLKSFNWLTYYGGKFSTSDHRGVFMSDALDLLPADCWRWYLMANAPESDDASFTWDLFGTAVNKELVGTFGNLVNRTVTQVSRHFDDVVPDGGEPEQLELDLADTCRRAPRGVPGPPGRPGVPQGRHGTAGAVGRGQRLPGGPRAVEDDQGRPGPHRVHVAHRGQPGRAHRCRVRPVDPRSMCNPARRLPLGGLVRGAAAPGAGGGPAAGSG